MYHLTLQSGRTWIGKCLLALVIAVGFAGTSYAQQFDAPHEVLRKKNKDKWAAEDKQINDRLAALEKRFGPCWSILLSRSGFPFRDASLLGR